MPESTREQAPDAAPPPPAGGRIEVDDVEKTYGVGSFAKTVVHDCSFLIERGKLTVMIGPSGCGK
ncbi:MAG TPA: hypothetical protein VLV85_18395, partial [Stellaceae bacterium]|nr:hypothetical protein [Stellaceae bacterium]